MQQADRRPSHVKEQRGEHARPNVNAVLKTIANTANGAITHRPADDAHAGVEDLIENASRAAIGARRPTGARLIAKPKISANTISGSISPSSARTAESSGLRGISSISTSLERLRRGGVGLERATPPTVASALQRQVRAGPDDVDEQHADDHRRRAEETA